MKTLYSDYVEAIHFDNKNSFSTGALTAPLPLYTWMAIEGFFYYHFALINNMIERGKMIATVWTQAGCMACKEEKTLLKAEGYEVKEIVVDDDASMDRDAFAQIQLQDGMFPVVMIDGCFKVPAAISKKLEW